MQKFTTVALMALAAAFLGGFVRAQKAPALDAEEKEAAVKVSKALSDSDRLAIEEAVSQVSPSLVRIMVVEPSYYGGRQNKLVKSGSGAIISPEGYIVTNHHVAGKAINLMVTLPNREEVPARLVGTDAATDIAVIQLTPDDPIEYPAASFGDSDSVRVGDRVVAMGSPAGLSQSVTTGIISNTEMVIPGAMSSSFNLDGENVGELVRWFGHDAFIYPGNSGGPLVNMDGEIIGINEISYALGGAIPGNLAKKVVDQIIENGHVDRAYIGTSFQPLLRSHKDTKGVLLASVLADSPAELAGLRPGDILTSLNDQPVHAQFMEDLPTINNLVADLPIEQDVPATFLRDGETSDTVITTERRPTAFTPSQVLKQWGMTARNLSLFTKLQIGRDTSRGALITSLSDGGPATEAKPALRVGDIVLKVGDREIHAVEDLVAWTEENISGEGERLPTIVTHEREGETLVTVVKVGIDPLDDPGRTVKKAWLPMETQVLTRDLAEEMGMDGNKGVRITRIYSDAEDLPFQVGDLITHVDGQRINATNAFDTEIFNTLIRQYRIGMEPEFTVIRDGEEMTLTAELRPSPDRAREKKRYRDLDLEFIVREATYFDLQKPEWQGADIDVIVESVTSGGDASLSGLRSDDAILRIGDMEINRVEDVQAAIDQAKAANAETVVIFIRRGTQSAFAEVLPSWANEELDSEAAAE
ncbi:MAG: PDZ domain-containing protein [Sumerlaeia bacterium]